MASKEIRSGIVFGTAVTQVEESNRHRRLLRSYWNLLRDFDFVSRTTLKWFWVEIEGFTVKSFIRA